MEKPLMEIWIYLNYHQNSAKAIFDVVVKPLIHLKYIQYFEASWTMYTKIIRISQAGKRSHISSPVCVFSKYIY